jgi:hypothetical protein
MKTRSIGDAAILSFAAILESMPNRQRMAASEYARAFLEGGFVTDVETRQIVQAIFFLLETDSQKQLERDFAGETQKGG